MAVDKSVGDWSNGFKVWNSYREQYPLPADLADRFVDSTYRNDVCPSYATKDGHLILWLHDEDTWRDMLGVEETSPHQIQMAFCPTGEAYGAEPFDRCRTVMFGTWEDALAHVRVTLSLLEGMQPGNEDAVMEAFLTDHAEKEDNE
jgi:hypothetical protein